MSAMPEEGMPDAMAVSRARSAPSASRTSTKRRNQVLRRAGGAAGCAEAGRGFPLRAISRGALPAPPPILAPGVQVDPDRAVAHLDRVDTHVVGEGIEGAAAAQVEARVVPVTGQDAVAAAATAQREAHVRAAVVDGVHGVFVVEERDTVAATGHDDHALPAHVVERGNTYEVTALAG